ncbi:DUF305 domain-containing protein [Amycolatopsis lurida]|uniref:DUF305 domain-containing protein n=1 Tax=Amycolatopsis sp. YIM 10 TaxID=2653857 RepID=UPI00128FE3F6|nr:DUF305 domain-containing protein [Amycolatopsis sp. YIM 10]QFU88147.1 hypothetical protein YIM_14810 [Amycolatopsis sp. YIM 10]
MRTFALLASLLAAVLLAGCSASGEENPPATGAGNESDIRFSQQMIPHHQQTLDIAAIAKERGTLPLVKTTAEEVSATEAAEIQQMTGWLRSWNVEVPAAGGHSGHAMPGMLTLQDIAALENASGAEFDQKWLSTLAKHLREGVAMAKNVQLTGAHEETKALARKIVEGQEAKIAEITAAQPAP